MRRAQPKKAWSPDHRYASSHDVRRRAIFDRPSAMTSEIDALLARAVPQDRWEAEFIRSVREQVRTGYNLTPKQVSSALQIIAEQQLREPKGDLGSGGASPQPCPEVATKAVADVARAERTDTRHPGSEASMR